MKSTTNREGDSKMENQQQASHHEHQVLGYVHPEVGSHILEACGCGASRWADHNGTQVEWAEGRDLSGEFVFLSDVSL